MLPFTGNLFPSHGNLGKRVRTEPKQRKLKLKSPLSYLPITYLTSTNWGTNQITGDGPPRSYLVCIDIVHTTGICMPAGLTNETNLNT
jgi:hypothetical protein